MDVKFYKIKLMSLIVKDGIGYGVNTGAVFYSDSRPDGSKLSSTKDTSTNIGSSVWADWGSDNQDPINMANDIENSGVLSAGIDSKVRMAIGKGIEPFLLISVDQDGNEQLEHIVDAEIQGWLEKNNSYLHSYKTIYNILSYGWASTQIILSKDRKQINRIFATDVFDARLEKRERATGIIKTMFLHSDWSTVSTESNSDLAKIDVLREDYELSDLQSRTSKHEFAILHRILKNGRQYYPRPLWKAAQAWVKVSRAVPEFKKAMHKNQMTIKYLITVSDSYWKRVHKGWDSYEPKKRDGIIQDKYDEINKFLTGEAAQGKSIISGKYTDPYTKNMVPDIEIEVLDDKMKEGKLLPDSAAADKQILFSMFFNPAIWGGNLLGDGASGGAGSGSDIREAFAVQIMLMHAERMLNCKVFDIVKHYNGWDKKYEVERIVPVKTATGTENKKITPRLVFRYKSGLLTTLDTGKSTKAQVQ